MGEAVGLKAARVAARVTGPDDDGYDEARAVWNGTIDRRPAAVVHAASVEEVVATIRLAREEGVPLAVRGGGHSLPGFSTVDDGVVLDLRGLRSVEVDLARQVAVVGGGATWADVDAVTCAHGLATTGGLVSSTGVGGLTLGGGIGWLTRYCGLACDNLLAATLVTADGQVRHVDAGSDPDLLWALRGGGGNFGVVTEFELRLHPVGDVTGGMLLFPLSRAEEVGAHYREWVRTLPDTFSTMLVAWVVPDDEAFPDEVRGLPALAVAGCHVGPTVEDELAPIRALGAAADLYEVMPYTDLQQMFDADVPAGRRYYFTGVYLDGCGAGVVDVLREALSDCPSAGCEIDVHQMGGAAGRVPVDATAFSGRAAAFAVNVIAAWDEPGADDAHREWARRTAAALQPFGSGETYVNFLGDVRDGDAVVAAYGRARFERLQQVKRRVDPTNLFRLNQNVRP